MEFIKKLIEKLYLNIEGNLAFYDSMTGLFNRNYYELVFKSKYANTGCFISMLDFDNLKQTNDKYSHTEGDKRIITVCEELKKLDNVIIMRLGGDEFLLMSHLNIDARLKQINKDLGCSGSFTHATILKSTTMTISEAVHTADIELYKNKSINKRRQTL